MRVAVCMSGGIRTLEHCFKTLPTLLEANACDYDVFAAFVSNDKEECQRAINLVQPYSFRIIAPSSFSEYFEKHVDSHGRKYGFSVAYPMAFSNHVANHLRKESGEKYDIVIRCRPDLYYANFTLRKTDDGTVNVPGISSYGNVCDQFAYGSERAMNRYYGWWNWLEKLDPVLLKRKHYGRCRMGISEQKGVFYLSPEFLLREYLTTNGLRIAKRDIDFKIIRPCHVGKPYNEIPINNQGYKGGEI